MLGIQMLDAAAAAIVTNTVVIRMIPLFSRL